MTVQDVQIVLNGAQRLNGLNHLNLKLEGEEDLKVGEFNHKGHKDHIEKERCARAPSALFHVQRLCRNAENATYVILNEVKNLMYSILSTAQILRLKPQNDIATPSPTGKIRMG